MKHINHDSSELVESEERFSLQIIEQKPGNNLGSFAEFKPRAKTSSASSCAPAKKLALFAILHAPEKKLTVLAIRLSILEKAATSLGVLGFIWASVVLLGGFVSTLQESDFWFITTILVIEGGRIFSRSHELEWQHMANWSLADAGINEFSTLKLCSHMIKRKVKAILNLNSETQVQQDEERLKNNDTEKTDNGNDQKMLSLTADVPFHRVFLSKNASRIFSWLQVSSALVCVVLSLIKLIKQDYGEINEDNSPLKKNRVSALNIFYALAIAEATLLLWRKAYWEWKVTYCKLMEEVKRECELGPDGIVPVRKFFFDTYSTCINGSIFAGLRFDMASFGIDLIISDIYDEQLVGARILRKFSSNERFSSDTLRKISISAAAMERLVDMLNWKDPEEEEIRLSAAEILSKLTEKKQNSLRITAISGFMESISSLLHITKHPSRVATEEVSEKEIMYDQGNYEYSALNNLGLLILKKLAQNLDICGEIGKTRGFLPRIVDFTDPREKLRINGTMTESHVLAMKRSLKLLKTLVRTTGTVGEQLRGRISENVFTIRNIREILCFGGKHVKLQILGMQILTSLALEDDAKERIGSTGGILKELFEIFFNQGRSETHDTERVAAGEALAMLAFESEQNCHRILKLNVVEKLVDSLENQAIRKGSARILSNLCAYAGPDCFKQLKGVGAAATTVLGAIMAEENKLQELMLGLATQVFKFMTPHESSDVFKQTSVEEIDFAMKLVEILQHNWYPSVKAPRIRRFTIELVIWMMRSQQSNIYVFRELGMEQVLENVMETASELESFNTFSGSVGLNRYKTTIASLIDEALELLSSDRYVEHKMHTTF
ncbi:hypothetical protein Scep_030501 [Stephania cephalantha]|uniref:Uncharacterized protein n=1 Tax=Stephania cephalantha TaxID=152367 RepID=A0AAP0HIN9_9MAGN